MSRFAAATLVAVTLVGCRTNDTGLQQDNYDEPIFELTEPPPGTWAPVGDIDVFGSAVNLEDIQVDNEPVLQNEDGSFETVFALQRGVNLIEARGTDERGDDFYLRHGVLAGDFKSPIAPVNGAVEARINEGGLDLLFGQAGSLIDVSTINDALAGGPPVYDQDILIGAGPGALDLGHMTVNIDAVDYDSLWIEGTPQDGKIEILVHIDNLWIDASATGEALIDIDADIDLWGDAFEVLGHITLAADDKELKVTWEDTASHFEGFGFDSDLVAGDVEDNFSNIIQPVLEEKITATIEEKVPPLLTSITSGLDFSFQTEILGRSIDADARFASAAIDTEGVELAMDLDVEVAGNMDYYYQGHLTSDGLPRPEIDRTQDMAVSMYDDLLNRVLFEAWKSGMLEQSLTTADDSLTPETINMLGGQDEGTINIRADLPPVVIDEGGMLEIQVAELIVEVLTPGGSLGERMEMAVSAEIPITPTVANGVFTLSVGYPAVDLVVRDAASNASTEALTQLLEASLPIATLLALLEDIEFPIPDLAGVAINNAVVQRDAGGAYTNITIDLKQAR